ncbi:sugar phosphate isomerase/epimerase [Desulfitobacterium sp. LBE]|uniref:sugar phosphate isomerase/epimerase family protein n=1 Tax=Desulfitobacterium sp. LBE TaxID=884086 RepID=UPI00119B38D4|nr:TIM barrel protein [Desulfitobacterium sp. LBE]TWH59732.1 sugar phosphate isomerase/epimerase [Desulfitobacterium sp. LBE]
MNISISNIAWSNAQDSDMYSYLKVEELTGLEIAPTRIFPQGPYENIASARKFADELFKVFGLIIPSMQSIWYGRNENIFGSNEERRILIDYTKKAIDFAEAIECSNLVFGCPRNRSYTMEKDIDMAGSFFLELGEYAKNHHTVLSIEANPVIYGTNFINTTQEAFSFTRDVNSEGFKVNIDFGTILHNQESLEPIEENIHLVNHIHISEPNLVVIEKRKLHNQLAEILKKKNYQGFVSIEMGKQDNLVLLKDVINYVKEVFA